MGHGHDHGAVARGAGNRIRIAIALAITVTVLVAELVGAAISGSLALLGDAGHMSSDAIGLAVALVASVVAARPATDRHTFGFQRVEVLGALINGIILIVVAVFVGVEGVKRLVSGIDHIDAWPMLVIATVGLLANIVAFAVLRGGDRTSINLRGALLEVLGDMLGSVAAIAAGAVILLTGFVQADAIASLVIAALIAPRAAILLRDVIRVLTESAPRDRDVEQIRSHLRETPGVVDVHDVHIWDITSGSPVFTAHVAVDPEIFVRGETGALLEKLSACLAGHFDVAHSTFQLEPAGHSQCEEHAHR
ncbi:cation diffusion facilitator family transporter [Salinibacterium sp. ZJ77]|uniref:cation diffusion facilitator family transporter n=1 Tax=Salinibacterium sp. ZJ77 TaxID=2708337 RepID=UPI00142360B5|nr:cation diffusion facilitator family transporter [Salinibacterium sp. ZJ77]